MEAAGVARQPPQAAPQPPGLSPLGVADVLPPKRQAVVDRLRRRIESYRRRQIDCMPRFDQSFSGLCEQNLQDTLLLKQRFLETKNKRAPKAKDKKQVDTAATNPSQPLQGVPGVGGMAGPGGTTATAALQSSVHVQQKFVKRPADDLDSSTPNNDSFEPPMKVQCTTQQHQSHQQNEVHKFSVEIVQQLEFTTSAANSQPQQISTNVTVKALTNASVKSDVSSPKSNPSTPASNMRPNSGIGCVDIGTFECKQEPDNEFADLDQCAAALEKDAAANGGNSFAGISDLIGDDSSDEFITPDELKTLINEISDYPEFMKKFDFEDLSVVNNTNNSVTDSLNVNGLKTEDTKDLPQNNQLDQVKTTQSPLLQQNSQYSPPVFDSQPKPTNRMGYSNIDFGKTELSPAAQTLKQMAEQHQNKHQMGLSFNPNNRTPNARSPYTDFSFQQSDFVGSPNSNSSNVNYHKQSPGFPQPDMIKQEMIFQGQNDFDMQKRKAAANAGMYKQQYSPYGSPSASGHGSPGYLPRGGSSSNGAPSGGAFSGGTPPRPSSGPGGQQQTTLQINQAQQLHINQSSHGHAIQVSAGQHLHLSGELKGNVSVAAQQGMFFNQSQQSSGQGQQQQQPGNHQGGQSGPVPGQQQQQQQQQQNQPGNGPQHQQGGPQHNPQQNNQQDSYTLSQSQTINFTQQTLKQRGANGPPGGGNPMGSNPMTTMGVSGVGVNPSSMGAGSMGGGPLGAGAMGAGTMGVGPRHTMEQQQKMMQQQQLLRAQQAAAAAMQQQQQQLGMARPPPPDYKTSAGMMHGMQPRYPAVPPNMRRMPHQPMPPSGPMMRPHNMYMMSQQHMSRGIYPRQQATMQAATPDSMPQHGSAEWRHMLMTQQQNVNFSGQMRPTFQHQGYSVGNGGTMQMTALQHQQMRTQGMVTGSMGQGPMGQTQTAMGQAQMASTQLNMGSPLNQQMMTHTQQQSMLQQNAAQMTMGGMHMSQSQSLSLSNQTIHQTQLNNQQLVNNQNNNQSNALSNFGQTADFSLEFLENLPAADTSNFTDQELLNFDADSGFNLQDIL